MAEQGRERALILVKAVPNASKNYGETVCCAGLTPEEHWRRQYPIRFRMMAEERFSRWDWVEYDWVKPRSDRRRESRRVQEGSLTVVGTLRPSERARLLSPVCVASTDVAAEQGHSLALVRPIDPAFSWRRKSASELAGEASAYELALRQQQPDFFDETVNYREEIETFHPSPYEFIMRWKDQEGRAHRHVCHDWETTATLFRRRARYEDAQILADLARTYGEDYPKKGVAFALGTVARRPTQWLLLGIVRLDEINQGELML